MKTYLIFLLIVIPSVCYAGYTPGDTLKIIIKDEGEVLLIADDSTEVAGFEKYDVNRMVEDALKGYDAQKKSVTISDNTGEVYLKDTTSRRKSKTSIWYDKTMRKDGKLKIKPIFDFGINGWFQNGKTPNNQGKDYAVRYWGSWHVALGLGKDLYLSDKFLIETGLSFSWYNFKFEHDNLRIDNQSDPIEFYLDTDPERNYKKSKLTVAYFGAKIIPTFTIYTLRFGAGMYGDFKLDDYTKIKYSENGSTSKRRDHGNRVGSFRYGLRVEMGSSDIMYFMTYDLNPLFPDGRGPDNLHPFTFGFTFFVD
ncbi:hypothetical protein [Aureibacter tunicatorum]|uniref:Outer membrane protein beta-barrel domain-containing protein n=1 Tax=Aureibacter tunicatorum TaxID=866807 RepID=A0AAE3XNS8_9BACT|nr:hypothetical protein [Aureibacter tunicatorum]MDR6239161.1 hypothetical protein [Aureibacter tunicatorum]BDD04913.1 hypothetical protein AUTU_23960 [Aureibacter tunicatorum]